MGDGTKSKRIVIVALHQGTCLHSIFLLPWKPVRELADIWETPSESPPHTHTHTQRERWRNPVWLCGNIWIHFILIIWMESKALERSNCCVCYLDLWSNPTDLPKAPLNLSVYLVNKSSREINSSLNCILSNEIDLLKLW